MVVGSIPYGYIRDEVGGILVDNNSAYYVEQIFKKFAQGEQKSTIRAWLKEEQVQRPCGDCNWTHNSLSSILNNRRYKGTEEFPQIISHELFNQVENIRKSRKNRTYCTDTSMYPLSYKIFCGHCGCIVHHKNYTRRGISVGGWVCSKDNESSGPICNELTIDDEIIVNQTIEVCNYIISNWPKFKMEKYNKFKVIQSSKVMQLDLEIRDELNKSSIDKERIQLLLNERTAEAWKCAKVNDFSLQSKLIEEAIEEQGTLLQSLEEKFFRKIIKRITLLPGGRVSFMLINGIILNKEYTVKRYERSEVIWKEV